MRDLVRPSGLQPAFDQGMVAELFDRPNVRHRAAADVRQRRAPPPAVATITNHSALDRLRLDRAAGDGQVSPLRRMLAKLLFQVLLCLGGSGENDQARGVAVEAVYARTCFMPRLSFCLSRVFFVPRASILAITRGSSSSSVG